MMAKSFNHKEEEPYPLLTHIPYRHCGTEEKRWSKTVISLLFLQLHPLFTSLRYSPLPLLATHASQAPSMETAKWPKVSF
jgi:hypothetical protein